MYFIKIFVTLITYLIVTVVSEIPIDESGRIECEPIIKRHASVHWINSLNLATIGSRKIQTGRLIYTSHYNYSFNGSLESPPSQRIKSYVSIMQVGRAQYFRIPFNVGRMYHFLHGDSVTFHLLNPVTKQYSQKELGLHNNQFFLFVPAGIWYAMDFHENIQDKHVVLGMTRIWNRQKGQESGKFGNQEELIKLFPNHKELVTKLTAS